MEPSLKKQRIATQTPESHLDECFKLFGGTVPAPEWSKKDLANFKKWHQNLEACFKTGEQLGWAVLGVLHTVFEIVAPRLRWPIYDVSLASLGEDDFDLDSLCRLFAVEDEVKLGPILRLVFRSGGSYATLFFGCGCETETYENKFWPQFHLEMHTLSESDLEKPLAKNAALDKLILCLGHGIGDVVVHLFSGMKAKVIHFSFHRHAPFPNTANVFLFEQEEPWWKEEEEEEEKD